METLGFGEGRKQGSDFSKLGRTSHKGTRHKGARPKGASRKGASREVAWALLRFL